MKNPVNPRIPGFLLKAGSQKVESEGFEPSSKQAIKLLSTRLFLAYFSMQSWPKTTRSALSLS